MKYSLSKICLVKVSQKSMSPPSNSPSFGIWIRNQNWENEVYEAVLVFSSEKTDSNEAIESSKVFFVLQTSIKSFLKQINHNAASLCKASNVCGRVQSLGDLCSEAEGVSRMRCAPARGGRSFLSPCIHKAGLPSRQLVASLWNLTTRLAASWKP